MPKRKHSNNLEDNLASLLRKVHKLEKKIKRKNNSSSGSNSAEDESPVVEPTQATLDAPAHTLDPEDWLTELPTSVTENVPVDVHQPDCINQPDDEEDIVIPQNTGLSKPCLDQETPGPSNTEAPTELDGDILEIFGDDPTNLVKHAPEIMPELAARVQHWATTGLDKEARKKLIDKYLLPSNCLQIGAPVMNAEIKAAMPASVLSRDKGIESKQSQMSSAISCLTNVINSQLDTTDKDKESLQKLMDATRLLCDIQHADSITRKNFTLFSLKKDVLKEHLSKTKIDTFLFGEDLSETLKSVKAVNKTGSELKLGSDNKNTTRRPTTRQVPKNLNRRAASARRQPRQAANPTQNRQPAPSWPATWQHQMLPPQPPPPPPPPPMHSSRTSYRQPPPQTRRRQY